MKYMEIMYTNVENYACLENLQDKGMLGVSMAVNLDYTGREACEKGHRFGPFVRYCYLVHVVTKGRGEYRVMGKTYQVSAGSAFVIFPGVESVYQASNDDPWTYCWVGMHGYNVEEFFGEMNITPDNPIIELTETEALEESVDEMLKMSQITHANELIRLGQTLRFMGHLERCRKVKSPAVQEHRYSARVYVEYAIDFIRNNYRGDVKIGDVAAHIGINRSYLSRNFKKETGMAPQEYLINYRLERAAELLTEGEESIGVISSRVGYSDQMTFSKAFKKKYGITPWKYRTERRKPLIRENDKNLDLTRVKL
ncbi:MAG: AraC family transcriptional regulator [Lachnospiraceae bacterium]|nr:AraC family transcriptional regulator [Lachnospiraceae bacterium]